MIVFEPALGQVLESFNASGPYVFLINLIVHFVIPALIILGGIGTFYVTFIALLSG